MIKKLLFCLIAFSSLATASHDLAFKHSIKLGGSMNTGNSVNTNMNGKLISAFDPDFKHHRFGYQMSIEGELNTSRHVESARNLKAVAEGRYALDPHNYFFVKGSVNYNAYTTYDFINRAALGYGRILIDSATQELRLEAGPGSLHQRIAGTDDFQTQVIANIDARYIAHISKTAEFSQSVNFDIGHFNTHIDTASAIRTTVIENLALELSFKTGYDTNIPRNSRNRVKFDTTSLVSVIYTLTS